VFLKYYKAMKLNTLFVAAVLASTSLSSCVFKTADENQLKYTHTTLVDGDAYAFFRQVGTIAPYEASYSKHVETVGSAQAKEVAGKVAKVFGEMMPQLDSLATKFHVDFPILGAEQYTAPSEATTTVAVEEDTATPDSVAAAAPVEIARHAEVYSDEAYLHHIQHQIAVVKEHFRRMSRNTNKELRDYAVAKSETIAELYKAAGGKEEHAHH